MLLDAEASQLLIVDVQARLAPAMPMRAAAIRAVARLLGAAQALEIPVTLSEHCADKIGPTVAELQNLLEGAAILPKRTFDASKTPAFAAHIQALERTQLIVCGMEAHVCVLQSAMGFKACGFEVAMVSDASASRASDNHGAGMARARAHGIDVVTSEMVLFEWLRDADNPAFRQVLSLIKE
ncbi:MAG: isochorismatase family protein [Geminicoccaceae bacterium]